MSAESVYLDETRMQDLDGRDFQNQSPYPWVNPENLLRDDGYRLLVDSLPDVSGFEKSFGVGRAHGQTSHDRFTLEYSEDLDVPAPWHEFIAELEGPVYRRFLRRMLGTRWFRLRYHWHYATTGCSISPHCDNKNKLGSHIFYMNTKDDWDPTWGGETLILDDHGRFERRSAPSYEEFDRITPSVAIGNRSLLFRRNGNSWHGMYPLQCPEDRLRKVFILVIHSNTPLDRIRALFKREPQGY